MSGSKNKLLPELVSLIHHIELNQEGRWEEALSNLILAALFIFDKPSTEDEILKFLESDFKINLQKNKINDQLKILSGSGGPLIFIKTEQKYKLSETKQGEMHSNVQISLGQDDKVAEIFKELILKNCPNLDANFIWESFNEKLLLPFIKEAGANVYLTITDKRKDMGVENVDSFLSQFAGGNDTYLRKCIKEFLNLNNDLVRNYILRYLNAFFLVEASGIKDENLDKINLLIKSKPKLSIFLDTNFILSIIGLEDVETNMAGESFLKLIKSISNRINVKLYVLDTTIKETKAHLSLLEERLGGLRFTLNLASAAINFELGGFVDRLASESKNAGHPISAQAYLAPYKNNLLAILKGKGVDLYNTDLRKLEESKEVYDDVEEAMDYDSHSHYPKKEIQWSHDIVLWHLIKSLRPSIIESPLDAKNWVITIDNRFLNFDIRKMKLGNNSYPICLFPVSFMQMLQFWVPRNPQMEDALFRNMRLPMLFPTFDPKTENAALRILDTLSRYENVQDLPEETVAALLMDSALRQKLLKEGDKTKQIGYIHEALVDEHAKIARRLGEERQQRKIAEIEIQENKAQISMQKEAAKKERLLRENTEHDLREQLEGIRKIVDAKELKEAQRILASNFYKKILIVPIILVLLAAFIIAFIAHTFLDNFWVYFIFILVVLLLFIVRNIKKKGELSEVINKRPWFLKFKSFYKWELIILSIVGTALLWKLVDYAWVPLLNFFKKIFQK